MEQKTVFISYRRSTSKYLARSIYQSLTMHGWDVFLDVTTIDGGDFDRIILRQIAARAHFILLISSGALERCVNEGDWLRREIEEAVRLDRNIVPILEEGADFNREIAYLPDDLQTVVSKKNYLPLPYYFFDAAMDALRTRFLKTPEYVPIQAAPAADRAEIQRRIAAVEAEAPVDAPSQPALVVAAEPPVQSPPGPARRSTPTRPSSSDLLPAPFDWIARSPVDTARSKPMSRA